MYKKFAYFLIFALLVSAFIPKASAQIHALEVLESDAQAIAPSTVIDEDFTLVAQGPGGSSIQWSFSPPDLFDEDGNYRPRLSGIISCGLTAILTFEGETITKTYTSTSYSKPAYRINGLIYEKSDGSTVRHMQKGCRVAAVDIEKNPRVEENATLLVGVYEQGRLISVLNTCVKKSGCLPLTNIMGDGQVGTEVRCFLWDGIDTCRPLAIPEQRSLEEDSDNNFFRTNTAVTGAGEDASAAIDGDPNTAFVFSDTPMERTHGKSLYLYRYSGEGSHPNAQYTLPQIDGELVFEQEFMLTESEHENGLLYLYDKNNVSVLSLVILGDVIVMANGSMVCDNIIPYHWYQLRVEMNTETERANVYIDGAGLENIPFRSINCNEISRLQIHNSADGESGLYVDNIRIMDDGTEILFEDFNDCEEGGLPNNWKRANVKEGFFVGASEFTDTHLSIYPQVILIDTGRYCSLAGATMTIPDGIQIKYYIEVSTNNQTYTRVASRLGTPASGIITDNLDIVEMRYFRLCIREALNSDGEYCNGAIQEIELEVSRKNETDNVAPYAYVSAGSEQNTSLDARGLIDGIVSRYARRGEWNAKGGESNPKAYFSWDEPQSIDTIEIFGRLTDAATIDAVEILFDDGEKLKVENIPNTGLPVTVQFDAKTVNWLRFRLLGIKSNPGLSEVRILKSGIKTEKINYLLPWKTVPIPTNYGGQWVVSDDLDGDGVVDFVSARVYYEYGNHEVTTVCAFTLDGELLWTWGNPGSGQTTCSSDLPCQIYDIDQDGEKEVLFCTREHLYILDSKGREKKVYELPSCEAHPNEWASDAIIIADIKGNGYPSDIIVKTRYTDVWAYSKDWELLWHHCMPNGMKTAHAPTPLDIDNDGKDEVFAGFCFVDDDGTIISPLQKDEFTLPLARGHVDSFATLKFEAGMPLSDMRFAVSPCGANDFFIIDGTGKKVWESQTGMHYETLLTGNFMESPSAVQIVTNPSGIGNAEPIGGSGYNPILIYDLQSNGEQGETYALMAEHWGFTTNRFIYSINFGGMYDCVYQPSDHILIDASGNTKARLLSAHRDSYASMRWASFNGYHNDMDGDGTQDIVSLSRRNGVWYISIYQNPEGKVTASKLGTGYNYSYY